MPSLLVVDDEPNVCYLLRVSVGIAATHGLRRGFRSQEAIKIGSARQRPTP